MNILRISSRDTLEFRKNQLFPSLSTQQCHFEGDEDGKTFHLGAFVDKRFVSVASFYFNNHPKLSSPNQFELRGMATHSDFRKCGFGSALLKMAFSVAKQNQCPIVWCNARQTAIGYYHSVGFVGIGKSFEEDDINYQLMVKELEF